MERKSEDEIAQLRKEQSDLHQELRDLQRELFQKEMIALHKALNGQVWKIVGALSLIGSAAGAVGYLLKLWR